MKKYLLLIIFAVIGMLLFPLYTVEQDKGLVYANEIREGEVTASSLNVRDRAAMSSAIIGGIPRGTKVKITGSSGDFYAIDYRNRTAYVHSSYIKVTSAPEQVSGTGTITASSLHVRSGPSVRHSVIGGLRRGQTVTVTGSSNDWYKIRINNRDGYVFSDFVRISSGSGSSGSSGNSSESSSDANNSVTGSEPGAGLVTASRLNVRSQPATTGSIVGSLWMGSSIQLIAKSGDWYEIRHNGRKAFVHGNFVNVSKEPGSAGSSSGSTALNRKGEITASSLNIRSAATTSSSIVGSFRKGQQVNLTGQSGEWYQVSHNNRSAFIHGNFVRVLSNDETARENSGSSGSGSLRGKTIFIDPGHGGRDPGAVVRSTIFESHIVLSISQKLKSELEREGARVVMSRTGDQTVSRTSRVNQASQSGADIFVSVHANAFTVSSANGSEVYYSSNRYSNESRRLAQGVQTHLVRDLGTTNRGVKDGRIQVLQTATMPAILIEPAFMTHQSDLHILQNRQDDIAKAITKGIQAYFE